MKRRIKQRFGDHKRSNRFKNDGFDYIVLEESLDRNYIENMEEYYIKKFNTYECGLNDTISGKGYGHNSQKFTTRGYVFSDEQREKMSNSAKERALREGTEYRSELTKKTWTNDDYRKHQSEIRKGKRLRPPKLSDEQVMEIRNLYEMEKDIIERDLIEINKQRMEKNSGWYPLKVHSEFAKKYSKKYGVSNVTITNIVLNKSRTKILPNIKDEL